MTTAGQFHHIVLDVSNLERSVDFYGNGLCLEPVPTNVVPSEGPAPTAVFKTDNGQYVVLVESETVKPDGPRCHTNFMLAPEHYPEVFERLKARNCLVKDHMVEQGRRSVGVLTTYLDDPDDRRLQITSYTEEAFLLPAAGRGKVVAGRVDDFPVGSVTHIKEGKFFLVRLADGVLALNQVCTHQQCNVTYQQEHYSFWCPCHNRKFTRTGDQVAIKKDVPPLHKYAVEFVDGQIIVDTDTTLPRMQDDVDKMIPIPPGVATAR
ncbi:MAG: Rieske (2Fe-2S) iron-sulfur protein [Chloroflexi bacterium]|nr:Rieske (2Fe-2S) iron-sulfur protein [Chloroflexota bacterium]